MGGCGSEGGGWRWGGWRKRGSCVVCSFSPRLLSDGSLLSLFLSLSLSFLLSFCCEKTSVVRRLSCCSVLYRQEWFTIKVKLKLEKNTVLDIRIFSKCLHRQSEIVHDVFAHTVVYQTIMRHIKFNDNFFLFLLGQSN